MYEASSIKVDIEGKSATILKITKLAMFGSI